MGGSNKLTIVSGTRFGRWSVEGEASPAQLTRGDSLRRFHVRCDCGAVAVVQLMHLRNGRSTSCGCVKSERLTDRNTVHGHSSRKRGISHEYRSWEHMIQRCTNPKATGYERWGGRGIRVCDEWRNNFEAFLAHVGPKPSPAHSIDRINNDGHYEPSNVRWATPAEQNRNRGQARRRVL